MEIQNLSIGDIVLYKDVRAKIEKIDGTFTKTDGKNTVIGSVCFETENGYCGSACVDEIKPIEITDKLLEKIGFIKEPTYKYYYKNVNIGKDCKFKFRVNNEGHKLYKCDYSLVTWGKFIKYLHELQHELNDANIKLDFNL